MNKGIYLIGVFCLAFLNLNAKNQNNPDSIKSIYIYYEKSQDNNVGFEFVIENHADTWKLFQIKSFYLPPSGKNEFEMFEILDKYFFSDKIDFFGKLRSDFFDLKLSNSKYSKSQVKYFYASRLMEKCRLLNSKEKIFLSNVEFYRINDFYKKYSFNVYPIQQDELLHSIGIDSNWLMKNKDLIYKEYLESKIGDSSNKCIDKVINYDNLKRIVPYLFYENPFDTKNETSHMSLVFNLFNGEKISIKYGGERSWFLPIIINDSIESYDLHFMKNILEILPSNDCSLIGELETEIFQKELFLKAYSIYCD